MAPDYQDDVVGNPVSFSLSGIVATGEELEWSAILIATAKNQSDFQGMAISGASSVLTSGFVNLSIVPASLKYLHGQIYASIEFLSECGELPIRYPLAVVNKITMTAAVRHGIAQATREVNYSSFAIEVNSIVLPDGRFALEDLLRNALITHSPLRIQSVSNERARFSDATL